MIDKQTHNPYDLVSYKPKKIIISHNDKDSDTKDLLTYKFNFEVTGSNIERLLLLGAGYAEGDIETNHYILDENDIQKLVDQLLIEKERIEKSKKAKEEVKYLHSILNAYLDEGYVESITLEYKPTSLPPYFSPLLYKAFNIKPNFRKDIDIPSEVNTAFNFLEVLSLSLNEGKFDETMNYIRNYKDIPIHFIGYDRDKEIEKRKKEAMKELKEYPDDKIGYSDADRTKYLNMLKDLNIPVNVLSHKGKK